MGKKGKKTKMAVGGRIDANKRNQKFRADQKKSRFLNDFTTQI